eukprot:COSAG03_NODE_341_length_8828_cov_77.724940_2_plen_143_part_00
MAAGSAAGGGTRRRGGLLVESTYRRAARHEPGALPDGDGADGRICGDRWYVLGGSCPRAGWRLARAPEVGADVEHGPLDSDDALVRPVASHSVWQGRAGSITARLVARAAATPLVGSTRRWPPATASPISVRPPLLDWQSRW